MAYNFDISPLNPIRFYQLADYLEAFKPSTNPNQYNIFNPNYNYRQFDEDFFYRNILSFDEKRGYYQPFQQGDNIRIQFLGVDDIPSGTYAGNPYTCYLLDACGKIWGTYNVTSPSVTLINGSRIREVYIPLFNVPEGYYQIAIRRRQISVFDDSRWHVISEPIWVKTQHHNTTLVKYSNSKNTQGIIFEFGMEFEYRVHGAVMDLETMSKFNVYEDEPMNLTMLSSVPYRQWTWNIGGEGMQIPEWMADKIERLTGCDTMTIDGKAYTRAEGAKLEANPKPLTPIASYSMKIREASSDNSLYVNDYDFVYKMYPVCDSEYFYVRDVTYGSGPTTTQIRRIFNGSRNFIDYLNGDFKIVNSVGGTFGITADGYYGYRPSSSTDATAFQSFTITDLLPYGIYFDVDITDGSVNTFEIDLVDTSGTFKYAVDYGDGTATTYNTSAVPLTLTKAYGSANKFRCVLCVDQMEDYSITSSDDIVVAIGGTLADTTLSATFTGNIIKRVGNLYGNLNGSFQSIDFTGNLINSGAADNIIRDVYRERAAIAGSGPSVDLSGQTVSSPPSQQVKDALIPIIQQFGIGISTD